jgi:hypothetical protein
MPNGTDRCHTQPAQVVEAQAITAEGAVGSHGMRGHGPGVAASTESATLQSHNQQKTS